MLKNIFMLFSLLLVNTGVYADFRIEIRNNVSADIALKGFVSSYLDNVSPANLFTFILNPLPYKTNYVSSTGHTANEIRFGLSSGIDWGYVCLDANGDPTNVQNCYNSWVNLPANKQFLFPNDFLGCDINLAASDVVIDTMAKIINGVAFDTTLVRFIFARNMNINYVVVRRDIDNNRDLTRGRLVSRTDNCYPYRS